jgi:hypothetical protein
MRVFIFFITFLPVLLMAQDKWQVKGIEGKAVVFDDGTRFETPLYNLEYLGKLKTNEGPPFLILSGNDCDKCTAPEEIYIHSPAKGPLSLELVANRFPYPGKEFTRKDSMLLYDARVFLGTVLFNKPAAIIWYQKMRMPDGKMHENIFIAEVVNNNLKKSLQPAGTVDINETLRLLDAGKCIEIEGKEYLTER